MKHVTISDIAKSAGVGTATVDRVLNGRSSTKPATVAKVLKAARDLGYRDKQSKILVVEEPEPQDVKGAFRVGFVLLSESYSFYRTLSDSLKKQAKRYTNIEPEFVFLAFNQIEEAATAIINFSKSVDIVGVVAQDHPLIRHAVNEVAEDGTKVITMLSGLSPCKQAAYIGWDNKKAGRTAAWVVEHLYPDAGKIAIFIGDNRFLCQESCEISFRSYLRENGMHHLVLEPKKTCENIEEAYKETMQLFDAHPDITLIYAPCGGVEGIARALRELEIQRKVTLLCHGPLNEQQLMFIDGTIDVMFLHRLDEFSNYTMAACKKVFSDRECGFLNVSVGFELVTIENC
ncbi:LacI family DNA-binding transcriptional regulator [Vibrio sp.]|uniref:Autoinducer 2-binding periplasmic protein LuxP n=1 Tax=Vibrio viridaestus TaxID=2487322 RepID=A0A3N9TG91_9VIBR|nr:LacI family DNA-binding transcriptional regulator [Vibrio viridaestus]MDC0611530.1 LacI family DNA-binding transcriptional regulator [Vibrio sp.]RQW63169.1 LacI family transcriptional regulator [Vibrio viridaestus]